MTLLLAHFLLLTLASYATAGWLVRHALERLLATAALIWSNIVAVGLVLSLLGKLGEPAWLFRGSLLTAFPTFFLVRRYANSLTAPGHTAPAPAGGQRSQGLHLAAALTLLPLLVANLAIAATYEPNNYDSLTYHLPRVMYYLGQGSLAHFQTADFRQVFYPFDFNLLQLVCIADEAPLQVVNFFDVAAWVVTGLAVYRIARRSGCSYDASLVAAWLTLTSTEVLAQATSTILDLPSGAALVTCLLFVLRWKDSRQSSDALIAGLAASLSMGTKLTVAFFGPGVVLLILLFWYKAWRQGTAAGFFRGVRAWIGPALLAGALTAPFILYNLKATGLLMTHRMDFTLNKPFELGCGLHTAKVYLVQLFFEPLGRFSFDLNWIGTLNTWFSRHVFSDWKEAYVFSELYTIPPDLNEDHVFFGFAGPLFLICAGICLWRDRRLRAPIGWIALLGLGWFLTYFATNKWSLYNQRYFVPALVLLAPCAGAVWDAGGGRIRRLVFSVVAATGLWFSVHYLVYNTIRPVPFVGTKRPLVMPVLPKLLKARLSEQPRLNINSYGTNERIFPLLHLGRHQRITSGPEINPDRYNVFSFWEATRNYIFSNLAYSASYTLVPFPTKPTAGVEFLGTVLGSGDAFDYVGIVPHANDQPSTPQNRHLGVVTEYSSDTNDPIRLNNGRLRVFGLNPGDHAHVRISAESADGSRVVLLTVNHTEWTQVTVRKPFKRLLIEVLADADGQVIGLGEMPFTARPSDNLSPPAIDPATAFISELIGSDASRTIQVKGLAELEGPYEQWDMPIFRWAKAAVVKISVPADDKLKRLRLSFSVRLQAREDAYLDLVHNGKSIQSLHLQNRTEWYNRSIEVVPTPGINVFELRDLTNRDTPDWLAYLEQNPDVKNYVMAMNQPLEAGAQEHYETHGRAEGRFLPVRSDSAAAGLPPDSLYFAYRSLRVEGITSK